LETEKVQEMKDPGENSGGNDLDGILRDDGGNEAVAC
jgi:hypothetical protein